MQVSKYILSFFVDRYSVSVMIVAPLLAVWQLIRRYNEELEYVIFVII